MAGKSRDSRSSSAWALQARQHGVVTRQQLLDIGFSKSGIEHRLATGRLHRAAQGVYLVGWNRLTRERRWMVVVLACGAGAMLSHRSAAALWNIDREHPRWIDVSVRRDAHPQRPGTRIHSRLSLPAKEVGERLNIPLTRPVLTLIDLATELSPKRLERAVNEADKRDLVAPDSLRTALDDYVGQPGVKALRALLDRHTFRLSDTELEVLFRPIAASAGLPTPLTKQWVNNFEVDFFWPDLGLVVETDGWRYHRTPAAQSSDALRDQTHTASGLTPLRFSHYQVKYEPGHVLEVLARTAANLRR
jgi:very-short-patch-repair endonuclease